MMSNQLTIIQKTIFWHWIIWNRGLQEQKQHQKPNMIHMILMI